MNYHARELGLIGKSNGAFSSTRIGIFDGETRIGEYVRNYPSHGVATFCPFELRGKWYSLYSRDYTATRVMSLPDCRDLGGEEPESCGFCPVEYFVPELTGRVWNPDDLRPAVNRRDQERSKVEYDEWSSRNPFVTRHAEFGFVHGCHWGSPYWVRFIDLSRADEGILAIDDRFGTEKIRGNLKDRVDADVDEFISDEDVRISIDYTITFDKTGKLLYPEFNKDAK